MEVSRWSREGTPVTLLRGGGGVRGPGPGSRRRFRSATGQSLQANAAALAAPAALSPHPWHRTGSAPRPGQESADEDPAQPGDVPSEEKAGAAGRSWSDFLESKLLAAQSKAVERRLRRATGLPRRGEIPHAPRLPSRQRSPDPGGFFRLTRSRIRTGINVKELGISCLCTYCRVVSGGSSWPYCCPSWWRDVTTPSFPSFPPFPPLTTTPSFPHRRHGSDQAEHIPQG